MGSDIDEGAMETLRNFKKPHKKQDEETLRDEITSIIYGADWKDTDIAKAFKPDVEAVMSLITERDKKIANEARIDELKKLRDQTRETTAPNAWVSDAGVAQSIRVHTNSLLERRIAELEQESKS